MTNVIFTGYFNILFSFGYSYFPIAIGYFLLKYQKKIWIKSEENWICKSFYA